MDLEEAPPETAASRGRAGWRRRSNLGGEIVIQVDVWLYGPLAKYAGDANRGSHGHVVLELPEGTRMRDLLDRLGIPPAEKGLTFVNGALTDTPGMEADTERELADGDRVGLCHRLSMWPFQYRFGAAVGEELKSAMQQRPDGGVYHTAKAAKTEDSDA
jgi:hypothetical protein